MNVSFFNLPFNHAIIAFGLNSQISISKTRLTGLKWFRFNLESVGIFALDPINDRTIAMGGRMKSNFGSIDLTHASSATPDEPTDLCHLPYLFSVNAWHSFDS